MKYKPLILLCIYLFTQSISAQCSMCRAVLESGADAATAESINDGIVYLMAIPYVLVGLVGIVIYKTFYKNRKK